MNVKNWAFLICVLHFCAFNSYAAEEKCNYCKKDLKMKKIDQDMKTNSLFKRYFKDNSNKIIDYEYECIDELEFNQTLWVEFSNDSPQMTFRLAGVHYLKSILLSNECNEINLTYLVKYRLLSYVEEILTHPNSTYPQYLVLSMLRNVDAEAKITLDLENSTTYEVKLYAGMYDSNNNSQSVYHLGSFLIENTNLLNVSSNYTIDSVLAYIREISIDRVILSVKSLKFEDVTNLSPTYILYNRQKNNYIKGSLIKLENHKNIFKIESLEPNTIYKLRIMIGKDSFLIMSDLIHFKTLQKPSFNSENEQKNHTSLSAKVNIGSFASLWSENVRLFYYVNFLKSYKMQIFNNDIKKLIYNYEAKEFNLSNNTLDHYEIANGTTSYFIGLDFPKNNLQSNTEYKMSLNLAGEINSHIEESRTLKMQAHKGIITEVNRPTKLPYLIFIASIVIIVLIITVIIAQKFIKKIFREKKLSENYEGDVKTNLIYNKNQRRCNLSECVNIKENHIKIINKIGRGEFGEVFKASYKINGSKTKIVAIKKLNEMATDYEKRSFIKEAITLNTFNNKNLIKLIGIVKGNDTIPKYIVLEYMNKGDLLGFLRSNTSKDILDQKKSVKLCIDIANGCSYLEQKNYIHRDIAARNCLVHMEENKELITKVGDFGLGKEIYASHYYKQINQHPIPLRWMSPEAIKEQIFTNKSDVWSFGVVVWEIFTFGGHPYSDKDHSEVKSHILNGGILEISPEVPSKIHCLMKTCWSYESKDRPTFSEIYDSLVDIHKSLS